MLNPFYQYYECCDCVIQSALVRVSCIKYHGIPCCYYHHTDTDIYTTPTNLYRLYIGRFDSDAELEVNGTGVKIVQKLQPPYFYKRLFELREAKKRGSLSRVDFRRVNRMMWNLKKYDNSMVIPDTIDWEQIIEPREQINDETTLLMIDSSSD